MTGPLRSTKGARPGVETPNASDDGEGAVGPVGSDAQTSTGEDFPEDTLAWVLEVARSEDRLKHQREALMQLAGKEAAARQAAESAGEAKTLFLANMSHELRTPLNAIIGITEMMLEDVREEQLDRFLEPLERVHRAGEHLLMLINDILDISKIEAGKMTLWPEDIDVAAAIEDAVATVQPLAEKNGNRIELWCADDLGSIYADPLRVKQILINLLSNACKFTEQGLVGIAATREAHPGADGPGPHIVIRVSDTGIGMTPDQVAQLFQHFVQADSARSTRAQGTGLGLAISRKLSGMMGGEIDVDSEPGVGSTFSLYLPVAARAAREAEVPTTAGDDVGVRAHAELLVIQGRLGLDRILAPFGAAGVSVVRAEGGGNGLSRAKDQFPDLIIIDATISAPGPWDIVAALRAAPETVAIPILLCGPAGEQTDDGALFYAGEVLNLLPKPVDRQRLREFVKRAVPPGPPAHLLLVEDDAAARLFLGRTLQMDGWAITEAEDGIQGLERLAEARPDLVLLDLNMPRLDGFGFLEEVRKDRAWDDLPVLIVTARDLSGLDHARLNNGIARLRCNGPFDADQVRDVVRRRLEAIAGDPAAPAAGPSPEASQAGPR